MTNKIGKKRKITFWTRLGFGMGGMLNSGALTFTHSYMVLFLSTGLLEDVEQELAAGGYAPDTPAAIVYKATWPEQRVVRCTVGSLAESTKAAGITKTALIVVGDFLGTRYERSKLYDPAFTTEFRKGTDQ